MILKGWRIGILFSVMLVLVGCSVTEEEALELGRQAYIVSIEEETEQSNVEMDEVQIFLPRGFEVIEEQEYNILLQQDDQLFVLFHQPSEPPTSTIRLKEDMESAGTAIIYEVRETDELVSYLIVEEGEEEGLLLVKTAVGGAKISTLSTYKRLENDISAMTQIVHSYQANIE
ncbi:hypothetical protein [Halalkalibacter alkalisediminis]|uniref:Uncharacterized protein n=1 Tax=Halalkalibacter alkalisediminis TaxID=935616 RepID=A0ABV6NMM3_9BACI|nr:hypothetical protein [Halalkalibacter alkalisediminis]